MHRCWMCKLQRRINDDAKQWKRMVTKATFVGHGFTRKPIEYEKFVCLLLHLGVLLWIACFLGLVPLLSFELLESAAVAHYFDVATTQKADASSLNLWAWTANPSAILKVVWLTIIGGCASGDNIVVSNSGPLPGFSAVVGSSSSSSQQGRQGLTYRVIIHLDLHEDFTQGSSASRFQNKFDWRFGVVDGEAAVRDRGQPAVEARRNDDNDRRRRDDDDERRRRDRGNNDDRRDRDAGRQASWGARFFRSCSRAAGERGEGRDRDGRREEDRRDRRHGGVAQEGVGDGDTAPAGGQAAPIASLERTPQAVLRRDGALVWRRVQQPPAPATPASLTPSRGRSPLCSQSPSSARRRSRDNLTSPGSPTSVLPATMSSKGGQAACMDSLSKQVQEALRICSPSQLVQPLRLLSRPPGFEGSLTPPLIINETPQRSPAAEDRATLLPDGMQNLFQQQPGGLLGAPPSPRRLPASRRKTLAGVTIGYTLRRSSARLRAAGRARVAPAEEVAQKIVCRGLGIVQDGEDITEAAINALEIKFKDQLSDEVIGALRQIFKLDDAAALAAEEALIDRGGAAALDHEEELLLSNA